MEVFDGCELIVSPSSSCVGTMRERHPELRGRLFELSELLVHQLGVTDVGASFPHRVVYHPTCHSLRLTAVGDAPLALLRAVEDLDLVELPDARECCGFGGTFAIKNADTSTAMAIDKCAAIVSTGASVVTALDSSCLLQIGGRLSREGAEVRTMHLAEILAQTAGG
jgi:L-lactate dehydrogenase complex protein LldE